MTCAKTIKKIANNLGTHSIHIKMFALRCDDDIEKCLAIYNDFKKDAPKPFVKWVGGKRQLAKQFRDLNLYPPDEFDPSRSFYFEPFVGGGAMFFDLMPKKAILSDMNPELVITYNVIKSNVEELISKLKEHKKKNSKEYFLKVRSQDNNKLSFFNNYIYEHTI